MTINSKNMWIEINKNRREILESIIRCLNEILHSHEVPEEQKTQIIELEQFVKTTLERIAHIDEGNKHESDAEKDERQSIKSSLTELKEKMSEHISIVENMGKANVIESHVFDNICEKLNKVKLDFDKEMQIEEQWKNEGRPWSHDHASPTQEELKDAQKKILIHHNKEIQDVKEHIDIINDSISHELQNISRAEHRTEEDVAKLHEIAQIEINLTEAIMRRLEADSERDSTLRPLLNAFTNFRHDYVEKIPRLTDAIADEERFFDQFSVGLTRKITELENAIREIEETEIRDIQANDQNHARQILVQFRQTLKGKIQEITESIRTHYDLRRNRSTLESSKLTVRHLHSDIEGLEHNLKSYEGFLSSFISQIQE